MSQVDLKIGPKIKAFRRQLGLQANKLAEELAISPSYLNLIEGGKRKIDGDLLLKICEKLNINIKVSDYHQSAISSGSDARAAAYIELEKDGITKWGVGINPNTTRASFEAIIVGLSKLIYN